MASSSSARNIPIAIRRADSNAPLPADYSTTPHGTIFSTTPGGTRIIYDRNKLLSLRNSPLSQTPPANLAHIPGITRANYSGPSHSSLPAHTSSLARPVLPYDATEDEIPEHSPSEPSSTTGEKDPTKSKKESPTEGRGDALFDLEME